MTPPPPRKTKAPASPPRGFRVRLCIDTEKELQVLGCGWRIVTCQFRGSNVLLHHNGSVASMKRRPSRIWCLRTGVCAGNVPSCAWWSPIRNHVWLRSSGLHEFEQVPRAGKGLLITGNGAGVGNCSTPRGAGTNPGTSSTLRTNGQAYLHSKDQRLNGYYVSPCNLLISTASAILGRSSRS